MSAASVSPQVRLRSVALPAEHGGWSFLFEPIALGLLLAPTLAGVWLALAAFGAFLLRHPAKLLVTDWRRGRRFARTALAERFALIYAAVVGLGLVLAILSAGFEILIPLLLAAPLVVVQLGFDAANHSRHAVPELAGPAALAALSASIAVAGGWELFPALALWVIMAARALPAVLYVRARLRLEREQSPPVAPVMIAHVVAIGAALLLAVAELVPFLAAVAMTILLGRAIYGLSPYRKPAKPKIIGLQELSLGILTVIMIVVGYLLNL